MASFMGRVEVERYSNGGVDVDVAERLMTVEGN